MHGGADPMPKTVHPRVRPRFHPHARPQGRTLRPAAGAAAGILHSTLQSSCASTAAAILSPSAGAFKPGGPIAQALRPTNPYGAYSQRADPSLQPFLTGSEEVISQNAVDAEIAGLVPTAADVRVPAKPTQFTFMGQGLHEGVPTNLAPTIAGIRDSDTRRAVAETQSGLRTTPAFTPLKSSAGIGGHTGAFVSLGANGPVTSNTQGQAEAHDSERGAIKTAIDNGLKGDAVPVAAAVGLLSVIPSGLEILGSGDLTGAQPNLVGINPLEAPNPAQAGTNRALYASEIDARREEAKTRTWSAYRQLPPLDQQKVRPPSPLRYPVDVTGRGGNYMQSQPLNLPPMPTFSGRYRQAELSAMLSQPFRLMGFPRQIPLPTPASPRQLAQASASASTPQVSNGPPPLKKQKKTSN